MNTPNNEIGTGQYNEPGAPGGSPGSVYRIVGSVVQIGLVVSVSLMLLGLLLVALQAQTVQVVPLSELLPLAFRGNGGAVITLGLLALLLTPIFYVIVTLITFVRQADYVFAAASLAVLLLLVISTVLGAE